MAAPVQKPPPPVECAAPEAPPGAEVEPQESAGEIIRQLEMGAVHIFHLKLVSQTYLFPHSKLHTCAHRCVHAHTYTFKQTSQ